MKQALYRKYRPKTFDEIQGQGNIVNILKNQIVNDNISHAYIFSGTRGTGKTSTAKIFSKAVNCLDPQNGNPCGKCANCQAISSESTMDIVEMDAASNRRIDDIRSLRDQVVYPPTNLKYKVYIIDEAHMITNEGFNALLKIMEEPPKHLIFILATTELDKIPDTILSRTQRFDFKSLSIEEIKSQVLDIANKENVSLESRAAEIIANVASGAMRDALSVMDQVISIGKGNISADDVFDLLGLFSDSIKKEYVKFIFDADTENLVKLIDREISKGKNSFNFIKEIISYFKDLMYIKIGIREDFTDGLIRDVSLERLVNSIDILLEYEDTMKKSDSADLLFNLASLRLLDYMPRKVMESKILNLEERILNIEKNGISSSKNIKKQKISDNYKNNDVVDIDKIDNILSEFDNENHDDEDLSKQNGKNKTYEILSLENNKTQSEDTLNQHEETLDKEIDKGLDDKSNKDHIQILLRILKEKYVHTKPLVDGIKDILQETSRIIIYLEKSCMSYTYSMSYFFRLAKKDLFEETGIEYEIKFEEYSEKNIKKEEKFDETKLEKIRELFPNENIIIKERK